MIVSCSSCSAKFNVPDAKVAGKKARMTCRKCGHSISIDGTRVEAAAAVSIPAPEPSRPRAAPPPLPPRPSPFPGEALEENTLSFSDKTVSLGQAEALALSQEARRDRPSTAEFTDEDANAKTSVSSPFSASAPSNPFESPLGPDDDLDNAMTRFDALGALGDNRPTPAAAVLPPIPPPRPGKAAPSRAPEEPAPDSGSLSTQIYEGQALPLPVPALQPLPPAPPAFHPPSVVVTQVPPGLPPFQPAPVAPRSEVPSASKPEQTGSGVFSQRPQTDPGSSLRPKLQSQYDSTGLTKNRTTFTAVQRYRATRRRQITAIGIVSLLASVSLGCALFYLTSPRKFYRAVDQATAQLAKLGLAEKTPDGASEGPPFNTIAASQALEEAANKAQSCTPTGDPARLLRIEVLFEHSGVARSVRVPPIHQNSELGKCIERAFMGARVPAFAGREVIVAKSLTLRASSPTGESPAQPPTGESPAGPPTGE